MNVPMIRGSSEDPLLSGSTVPQKANAPADDRGEDSCEVQVGDLGTVYVDLADGDVATAHRLFGPWLRVLRVLGHGPLCVECLRHVPRPPYSVCDPCHDEYVAGQRRRAGAQLRMAPLWEVAS
jgi:hypothetical protein